MNIFFLMNSNYSFRLYKKHVKKDKKRQNKIYKCAKNRINKCTRFFLMCVYGKQKINLTWPQSHKCLDQQGLSQGNNLCKIWVNLHQLKKILGLSQRLQLLSNIFAWVSRILDGDPQHLPQQPWQINGKYPMVKTFNE